MRGATHHRGVIDTFSAGYRIVNAHPWLLAAPLLLDSFFLLGPRLSIAALVANLFTWLSSLPDTDQASRDMLAASQATRVTALQLGIRFVQRVRA